MLKVHVHSYREAVLGAFEGIPAHRAADVKANTISGSGFHFPPIARVERPIVRVKVLTGEFGIGWNPIN
jgi:hypothetical protein